VLVPECQIGSSGYGKTLGLDVIRGVAGIRERPAAWCIQAIRKCPIVTAVRIGRVRASSPSWGEGDTITGREDEP